MAPQPTASPLVRLAGRAFGPMPLARQVQVHMWSAGADAFVAISLAGSLFFSVSVDAARSRIILYLLLTMAPFAVVAPLIGPLIDRVRGGHRVVLALACAGRAGLCLLMIRDLLSLLFYLEAFAVLVLGKTYSVAKSALVPRMVTSDDALVAANSRLSRMGSIGGATGGVVAVGASALGGAELALWLGAIVYTGGALFALRLPRPPATPRVPRGVQYEELHRPSVVVDAVAMSTLRAAVGFTAFLLAFGLKQAGEPTWFFAVVIATSTAGNFTGTFVAPLLRRFFHEQRLLFLMLVAVGVLALYGGSRYDRASILAVALVLGVAANVGSQAFSSLLQRHAPEADRGRAFAWFETRFQLAWVVGAAVPVLVNVPAWLGLLVLGAGLLTAATMHEAATRAQARVQARRSSAEVMARMTRIATAMLDEADQLVASGDGERAVITALAGVRAVADVGAEEATAEARLRLERVRRRLLDGEAVEPDEIADSIADARGAVVQATASLPASGAGGGAQPGGAATGTGSGSPTTEAPSTESSTVTR